MFVALEEEEGVQRREGNQPSRRFWVHPAWSTRESHGEYASLFQNLVDDQTKFYQYFRMSEGTFNILLEKISPFITKITTNYRRPIEPKHRLAVCLRYLATGDSMKTISFSYKLGHSTVQEIILETCQVICEQLQEELLPKPTTQRWKAIAQHYQEQWNFPNCLGLSMESMYLCKPLKIVDLCTIIIKGLFPLFS